MEKLKRSKCLKISTKRQWNAITSPVRMQIVALIESVGPQSVADLADHLSVPADSLYHHIRILLKAEVLIERGFRKTTRVAEAIYDLSADKIEFDIDLETGKNCANFDKLNQTVLRSAGRQLTAALTSGTGVLTGKSRNIYARYETAWLDSTDLAKVREHIEAISQIFRDSKDRQSGTLIMANCNLAPLETPGRRREKS